MTSYVMVVKIVVGTGAIDAFRRVLRLPVLVQGGCGWFSRRDHTRRRSSSRTVMTVKTNRHRVCLVASGRWIAGSR